MRTHPPPSPPLRRALAMLASAPRLGLALLALLTAGAAAAQTNNAPPKLRFAEDIRGNFALTGNTLAQDCRSTTPLPIVGRMPPIGTTVFGEPACYQRDTSPDFFWTLNDWTVESTGATTQPSLPLVASEPANPLAARSQAVLQLPPGAVVKYARLYWAATRFTSTGGDNIQAPDLTATFSRPGAAGFEQSITADDHAFQYSAGAEYQYQSTADVTSIIQGFGPGAYQVSDVLAMPLDSKSGEYIFDAWWLVVFYEQPGATKRHLKLFDSMKMVDGPPGVTFALNGFYVPDYAVDAKLGVIAFEGDNPSPDINDTFSFNGVLVTNDFNPANNFFNSTRSWTKKNASPSSDTPLTGLDPGADGVFDSIPVSNRFDRPQLTGTPGSMSGIDLDVVDVTVAKGDRTATALATTSGDRYWLAGFVTSITTQAPDFTNTVKSVENVTRKDGTYRPGDIIRYTVSTQNTGDDTSRDTVLRDVVPAGLTYKAGSLKLLTVAASDPTSAPVDLSDAPGDDLAEYNATTKTIRFFLGTGATATQGGRLKGVIVAGDVGESTSVSFEMTINDPLPTDTRVENQAIINAGGVLGIDPVDTPSHNPDGDGPTDIVVAIVPKVNITAPANGSLINTQTPTYTGTALPGTTVTLTHPTLGTLCTAVPVSAAGTWSCTSPGKSLPQGSNTLTAVARNSTGDTSTPSTSTFTVDSLKPNPPVITAPTSGQVFTIQRPKFEGTAEPNSLVTVTVDGTVIGRVIADSTGKWWITAPAPLLDGNHVVGATAKDAAGNVSDATSVPFVIDTKPPDTTITSAPPAKTTSPTATFNFSGTSGGTSAVASFDCSLDGASFLLNCAEGSSTGTKTYTGLADGRHTFRVRARDFKGNVDPTPAIHVWTIGVDTDNDGIVDSIENSTDTNPNDPDTDDDGIQDGTEDANVNGVVDPGETDPRDADTDNDGLQDGTEKGLSAPEGSGTNTTVFIADLDPATTTDPLDDDSDDDGLLDGNEDTNHNGRVDSGETNPLNRDTDNDGLQDGTERGLAAPQGTGTGAGMGFIPDADPATTTNPLDDDSDDDGLLDGNEDANHNGRVDSGETNPRSRDTDNDGLQDGTEKGLTAPQGTGTGAGFIPDANTATTTNPLDDDSDDDGLLDGNEDTDHNGRVDATETNPNNRDTDADGLQDGTERGLSAPQGTGTGAGFIADADPSTKTDPLNPDTDGGKVKDGDEDKNHNGRIDAGETDPLDPADDVVAVDTDGDGLPDSIEATLGTNPNDDDTDDDGIKDGNEDANHDGIIQATETSPLNPDTDNDGLQDGTEKGLTMPEGLGTNLGVFIADANSSTQTNPLDDDTDNDGLKDGNEDTDHNGRVDSGETNPLNPDTDNDGLQDGTERGLTAPQGTGTGAGFIADADPATTSNPLDDDSDDDGLLDGNEDANHNGRVDATETNPRNRDTDSDGIQDGTERGLAAPQGTGTGAGFIADADPSTKTDPLNPDTDGGKVNDGVEDKNHNGRIDAGETDPLNPADDASLLDTDGDGLPDSVEDKNGNGVVDPGETDPRNPDTDGDGLSDGTEDKNHNGVVDPGETSPLDADSDDDGLLDGNEDANHNGTVDAGETNPLNRDTDGDGLQDGTEKGLTAPQGTGAGTGAGFIPDADPSTTTSPTDADSDDDGLLDGNEDANHNGRVDSGETNPNNPDTDGDGLQDGTEKGLTAPQGTGTGAGFIPDADPTTTTNPLNPDTDGGSVSDGVEDKNHNGRIDAGETDPNNPADDKPVAAKDSDGDGIPDDVEIATGTDPNSADTDGDGVPDGLEDANHNGVVDPGETDPRKADSDGDGLSDGQEDKNHNGRVDEGETDPRNADTDGDGLSDGEELTFGSDPLLRDTDGGGLPDGDEKKAGTNPRDDSDDFLIAGRGCSSAGGVPLGWLASMLLAVPMMRRSRRSASRGAVAAGGLLGLMGVLSAPAADAQTVTPSPLSQAIDVQRYKPGPGITDILGVQGARVGQHLGWHLGASVNYASNPLGFLDPRQDDFVYDIVATQVTVDLMGSLSLWNRFELGVALPITYQSSQSGAAITPAFADGVSGAGLGDLRLVPKAHLLSVGGLSVGIAVPLHLPSGGSAGFRGGAGVSARPQLIGEWGSSGGLRLVANLGANLQGEQQVRNLRAGSELMYAVGAHVPFTEKLALRANLAGAYGLNDPDFEARPLELLAALQYRFSPGLAAHVGGGPGLTRGYGTPAFRLFAGLDWGQPGEARPEPTPEPLPAAPIDSDGDGITDDRDKCPQQAEDKDGFEDEDGCPDPDNDKDGILDAQDKCPLQPETVNGFEDADGCPDKAPPKDSDGDGIFDDQDKCPQQAEDKDGFEDEDGCPDPDNDKDGIPDAQDQCPLQPETINGVKDEDGCPDEGKSKVRLEANRIVILDKVYFATNKDVILPKSFGLLKQVSSVLKANPQIELLRVEGHTDDQGNDASNLNLSDRRAANVRTFLIKEGISGDRLEAKGFGETRPVETNKTAAGREANRRVEFNILRMSGQEVPKSP